MIRSTAAPRMLAAVAIAATAAVIAAPAASALTEAEITTSESLVDWVDNDGNGLLSLGDTFSVAYTVVNDSDETIFSFGLQTDSGRIGVCDATQLEPGDSVTCVTLPGWTVTQDMVDAGEFTDAGNIFLQPASGADPVVTYQPFSVAILPNTFDYTVQEVLTSWVDANSNGIVDLGDGISWRFDVTNTGTMSIDVSSSSLPCASTTIPVGETVSCGEQTTTISASDQGAGFIADTLLLHLVPTIDPNSEPSVSETQFQHAVETEQPVVDDEETAVESEEEAVADSTDDPTLSETGVEDAWISLVAAALVLTGAALLASRRQVRVAVRHVAA